MTEPTASSGVQRTFMVLRALAAAPAQGLRSTQLAEQLQLSSATTHRLLQALVAEGVVAMSEQGKQYRLGIDLFCMAASAGSVGGLREVAKPLLLRLCASLGDTVFLLVRSGFDAVCIDRVDGPIPIRSFTGDVGGRVPLGVGQGALAILAFLPDQEREEVLRYNIPRISQLGPYDEVYLRNGIERVRETGSAATPTGLLEGMAGVGVPILDRNGTAVAALSIGTITDRLRSDRLGMVTEMLRRSAVAISEQLNPFDPTLRRPSLSLSSQYGSQR